MPKVTIQVEPRPLDPSPEAVERRAQFLKEIIDDVVVPALLDRLLKERGMVP